MKRFLCVLMTICLSCCVFAACFDDADGGNSGTESRSESESVSIGESLSESEISSESENGSEKESETESETVSESERESGVYYIALDYKGYADKNSVKTIKVKKGEAISGLPETVVTGDSCVVFSKWTYNGGKITNGTIYNYDSDITIIAEYDRWTKNY